MLTEEQKKLVEDNYKLVFYVIKKMNLKDIDDWSGIASIGLCNAAKAYDKEKGAFVTFAITCIENEIKREFYTQARDKRDPKCNMAYLQSRALCQSESSCGEEDEIIDFIADEKGFGWESVVEIRQVLEEFLPTLKERDRKFFLGILQGKSYLEVSDECNCTRQNVHFHVKQVREQIADKLGVSL